MRHFSLRSQNSEYPRIFRVTGTNQNARKLLSTDLVNTKRIYSPLRYNVERTSVANDAMIVAWQRTKEQLTHSMEQAWRDTPDNGCKGD